MNIKLLSFISLFFILTGPATLHAQISVKADTAAIGMYDVYELNITHPHSYANNWEDVSVNVTFTGPDTITVSGFFYDQGIWKVRFAPPAAGSWTYQLTFKTPDTTFTDTGSFACNVSTTKGFLKKDPSDPFRLLFADGTLFNGIGLEDCELDFNNNGSPLNNFGFDGGFRTAGYQGSFANLETYMKAYGVQGAGFNLYRWTTDNCSFRLYQTIAAAGNTYDVNDGKFGDTLVRALRENKLRIWLTLFNTPVFNDITAATPTEEAAIERYINYVMARYGAYVDIWELFNESSASQYYYTAISAYIRKIDPYHRLISVSDERPALDCIDINSPHWYEKESEFESDARANSMITSRKSYQKPVIFGEQGNSVQNWDQLSALRMRLRAWTSFFAEGMLIFWNTSFAKDYKQPISANLYLGPEERGYIKALQQYTSTVDESVRPAVISVSNTSDVRAYSLSSLNTTLGYFHHYSNHTNNITTSFTTRLRKPGTIYWTNPENDSLVYSSALKFGTQTITSPPFKIDLAMQIVLDAGNDVFDENEKLDLLIYPNPATNEIALSGNFNGSAAVKIYTLDGRMILSVAQVNNDQPIDLSRLPGGLYVYRVQTDQRYAAGKLIINK